MSASNTDNTNAVNKFKLGYTECVQECIKFVNNSGNNSFVNASGHQSMTSEAMEKSSSVSARQRFLANLMRQYQQSMAAAAVNGMSQPQVPMPQPLRVPPIAHPSPKPIGLLSVAQAPPQPVSTENRRRSSVSPISSSSSSSSSSCCPQQSIQPNPNEAQIYENLSSSSSSSCNDDSSLWRPW